MQRSSTHIVRSDTLMEIGLGDLYSERAVASGMTTEKADLIFASLPYAILHEFQIPAYAAMKEQDKEFYDRLEKAGFWLDWGDDDSGLFMKYLRRGSGYYIDIGASQLIIDGEIKLKRGQVTEVVEDGVILNTGEKVEADLIVYATGYNSMNGWVADLMGQEMADRVGKVWGLGSDTTKDPWAHGRASSAICGSRPSRRTCGSTAATCTSRATIHSSCPYRSRPGWKTSPPPSMAYKTYTTCPDGRAARLPDVGRAASPNLKIAGVTAVMPTD